MSRQITRYQALAGLSIVALGALAFESVGTLQDQLGAIQHDLADVRDAKKALFESMDKLRAESETLRTLNQNLAGDVRENSDAVRALREKRSQLEGEFKLFVEGIGARKTQLETLVAALDSSRTKAESLGTAATNATTAIATLETKIPTIDTTKLKEIADTTSAVSAENLAKVKGALEVLQPLLVAPGLDPKTLASLATSLGSVSNETDRILACVQPKTTAAKPASDVEVPKPKNEKVEGKASPT